MRMPLFSRRGIVVLAALASLAFSAARGKAQEPMPPEVQAEPHDARAPLGAQGADAASVPGAWVTPLVLDFGPVGESSPADDRPLTTQHATRNTRYAAQGGYPCHRSKLS